MQGEDMCFGGSEGIATEEVCPWPVRCAVAQIRSHEQGFGAGSAHAVRTAKTEPYTC